MQFVAIGTGLFGENQPVDDQYNYMMTDSTGAGMSSAIWIEYINEVSKKYASAFVSIPGQGPNRHLLLQYAPTYPKPSRRTPRHHQLRRWVGDRHVIQLPVPD